MKNPKKLTSEEELIKALQDLDEFASGTNTPNKQGVITGITTDEGTEDDYDVFGPFDKPDKPANPNKYSSHKIYPYKRTAHPIAQEKDAVVYVDEARCKIIVRAGFNSDFLNLSRHLEGRVFIKKEEVDPLDPTKKRVIDKYWEFSLGPNNLRELLRILAICYKKISMPPLDLLWIWEDLLETEDIEAIYKIVVKRCPDTGETREKVDKFFRKFIDLTKNIIRASRRIELSDE